jgi:hypothetical protein
MAVYHQTLTLYKKKIQKANVSSWGRYCQQLEGASGSARLHGVIAKNHVNPIGTLTL